MMVERVCDGQQQQKEEEASGLFLPRKWMGVIFGRAGCGGGMMQIGGHAEIWLVRTI